MEGSDGCLRARAGGVRRDVSRLWGRDSSAQGRDRTHGSCLASTQGPSCAGLATDFRGLTAKPQAQSNEREDQRLAVGPRVGKHAAVQVKRRGRRAKMSACHVGRVQFVLSRSTATQYFLTFSLFTVELEFHHFLIARTSIDRVLRLDGGAVASVRHLRLGAAPAPAHVGSLQDLRRAQPAVDLLLRRGVHERPLAHAQGVPQGAALDGGGASRKPRGERE